MREPIPTPDVAGAKAATIIDAALAAPGSRPQVQAFFDEATFTVSYVVRDPSTSACAIIDSVLDYDPASGRTSERSADALIAYVREQGLDVVWQLETPRPRRSPVRRALSAGRSGRSSGDRGEDRSRSGDVRKNCSNAGPDFARDGRQFDHLFQDGEAFSIGGLSAIALHVPGHTPACHGLCHRRRDLRRRHPVHARLRHGALRLSRRRRGDLVRLDPAPAGAPR